jgi:serine/threonine protein kinase
MARAEKGVTQLKFGRYNALTKLGQGAMATVYLAEDPALNRMVAIKVIHSHLASNSSLIDRFTVEAKTAAALRNPNIVEIFDYGIEEDVQYLVMEYIDGPNLQFVLNMLGGQPMSPEVCAAVICQAADGLTVAEKTGVVHRDIKPENMMFTSEGSLKIADFGIAHIAEQNLTQTGSILGSPNFMSPEQIDGRKPTHQTDLFSLGAVFYYCLSGRKPFTGPNIPTIMRNICDLPHAPIPETIPDADPFLVNLIDTLLQKEPANRGKGARWLSLQLRSYLNQKGLLDLQESTKGFLNEVGKLGGNTTMVDTGTPLTPEDGLGGRPKAPLRPGMRMEKQVKPGSSFGAKPGTWNAGGSRAPSGYDQQDVDFNPRTNHGPPKKSMGLWIAGGAVGAVLLGAALLVVLLGHGGDGKEAKPVEPVEKPQPRVINVASVSLEPVSMEMEAGQTRKFLVDVRPLEAPQGLRWESSNPEIASVNEGEVMAVKAGRATIHAYSTQDASKQGLAEVIVTGRPVAVVNEKPIDRPDERPIEKPKPKPKPVDPSEAFVDHNPDAAKPADTEEKPAKAILTITSAPPFAEVIVDGRFLGTTPVKEKEMAPGKHKITVTHRSFPPLDTVVHLKAGDLTLRFRLFR